MLGVVTAVVSVASVVVQANVETEIFEKSIAHLSPGDKAAARDHRAACIREAAKIGARHEASQRQQQQPSTTLAFILGLICGS